MDNFRQSRVSVNIPAIYYLKGFQGEARILDISVGGIGLEVKQIFVPGDLIRIMFKLPTSEPITIEFWGIVMNVSGNILGIRYEEISNEAVEAISKYMGSALLKLGKSSKETF